MALLFPQTLKYRLEALSSACEGLVAKAETAAQVHNGRFIVRSCAALHELRFSLQEIAEDRLEEGYRFVETQLHDFRDVFINWCDNHITVHGPNASRDGSVSESDLLEQLTTFQQELSASFNSSLVEQFADESVRAQCSDRFHSDIGEAVAACRLHAVHSLQRSVV